MINIHLVRGDITKLEVDAIVNAAHPGLSAGGGVDGAIHKAAGPKLLGECLNLYGCPVGKARMTSGYNLPAKYVIHTVGPTWRGGKHNEEEDLKSCYESCLVFAEMQGLRSIAFPCISAGAFIFPKEKACDVALTSILDNKYDSIKDIYFVCFDAENYEIYKLEINKVLDEFSNFNFILESE